MNYFYSLNFLWIRMIQLSGICSANESLCDNGGYSMNLVASGNDGFDICAHATKRV